MGLPSARIPLHLTVTLAILSGCGADAPLDRDEPALVSDEVVERSEHQNAQRDAWITGAFLPATASVEDVLEDFGPAVARTVSPRPNLHIAGQIDSLAVFELPNGVSVTFYLVTDGPAFLASATVSEPGLLSLSTVDVGSTWNDVLTAFGPPHGESNGTPYYICGQCEVEEPVYVDVVGDRVSQIRFTFYLD